VEVLAMILFAIRDYRFRLAKLVEHHDELAALDLLHFTGQQLTDAIRELVADLGPFTFTHALDDPLLGRLHCAAAEFSEIHRNFHHVAGLELGIFEARLVDRDLPAGISHFVDHGFQQDDIDLAIPFVDLDFGLNRGPVLFRQGSMNAVL
jgi:hypothetical protein